MKVALVNSVMLNGGDAGIVYGTLDGIREILPEAQVTVFAHRAAAVARYYPELQTKPMLFDAWPAQRQTRAAMRLTFRLRSRVGLMSPAEKRFFRDLAGADVIVYCGGGYINESYNTSIVLDVIERTLDLGIPHMAYGHSIGPLIRRRTRLRVGRLLNRFSAVTVRDEASRDLVLQLGVQPDLTRLVADAAFCMRSMPRDALSGAEQDMVDSVSSFKRAGTGGPLIFMSVRDWGFPNKADSAALKDKLRAELLELLRRLLRETDCQICFFSTCQGRPEYGYDDAAAAAALVGDLAMGQDRILVLNGSLSPRAYPGLIRDCAGLVVSMRMHFVVYSILAGVPFVSLAYERKSVELCQSLGLQQYCHDVDDLDSAAVMKSILSVVASGDALRRTIGNLLPQVRSRSLQNAVTLAELSAGR